MAKKGSETEIYIAFEDYVPFDSSRPEKNLLRAIIQNALSDLKKPGEVGRKAREYFLSPEDDYLFSFHSVCNFLDLDPKTVLTVAGLRRNPYQKQQPQESAPAELPAVQQSAGEIAGS